MQTYNIAVLAGDGIGPEIMAQAIKVLEATQQKFGFKLNFNHFNIGGAAIDAFPRLSGQHAPYVAEQIKAYASGARKSPNEIMEDISKRMGEEEIKAVSNYIQGLK